MGALDDKPYGVNSADGSMGDENIAMKNNPKYDGDSGQSQKYEGQAPQRSSSASQVQFTGRQ
jgi:hypothetical protein